MEAGETPGEEEILTVVQWGRDGKENEVWEKSMMIVVNAGAQGGE